MNVVKDDESIFEEFRLNKRARENLQELTATEKIALKAMDIIVIRDTETGENVIV